LKTSDYNLMVKSFDLLSMVDNLEATDSKKLQEIIEQATTKPEHLKKSMLKYANHMAKLKDFLFRLDFEFLVEISTDSSYFVK
jgi:hypothetical protein